MTLYERYITGDDGFGFCYGTYWRGQTITIGNTGTNENHDVTSVKLKLYRAGSPGTVTVSIRAVDGEGKPTGADLASGTTNGNTLTTSGTGEWREITLSSYELVASTQYAIILRALDGNIDNKIAMINDTTSPTYTGGGELYTPNSGGTWYTGATKDYLFEEYGEAGAPPGHFMVPEKYW